MDRLHFWVGGDTGEAQRKSSVLAEALDLSAELTRRGWCDQGPQIRAWVSSALREQVSPDSTKAATGAQPWVGSCLRTLTEDIPGMCSIYSPFCNFSNKAIRKWVQCEWGKHGWERELTGKCRFHVFKTKESRQLVYQREEEQTPAHLCCF